MTKFEEILHQMVLEFDDMLKNGYASIGSKIPSSIKSTITSKNKYENQIIIYLSDYWIYIENGRRAGAKMPPINAIKKWIAYKGIKPSFRYKNKNTAYNSLAFLIARSISRNGIKARPILKPALEAITKKYVPLLLEALGKDAEDEIELELKSKKFKNIVIE